MSRKTYQKEKKGEITPIIWGSGITRNFTIYPLAMKN